ELFGATQKRPPQPEILAAQFRDVITVGAWTIGHDGDPLLRQPEPFVAKIVRVHSIGHTDAVTRKGEIIVGRVRHDSSAAAHLREPRRETARARGGPCCANDGRSKLTTCFS